MLCMNNIYMLKFSFEVLDDVGNIEGTKMVSIVKYYRMLLLYLLCLLIILLKYYFKNINWIIKKYFVFCNKMFSAKGTKIVCYNSHPLFK